MSCCKKNNKKIKKNETIKPKTRFFSGKMLMFAKLLLESFTYDFTETLWIQIAFAYFSFSFVDQKVTYQMENLEMFCLK